jgi:hypothetical protein
MITTTAKITSSPPTVMPMFAALSVRCTQAGVSLARRRGGTTGRRCSVSARALADWEFMSLRA